MASIPKLRLLPEYLAVMPFQGNLWLVPLPVQMTMTRRTPIPTNHWEFELNWMTSSKTPRQDAALSSAGAANKFTIALTGGDELTVKISAELKDAFSADVTDRAALRGDFTSFRELIDTLEDQPDGLAAGSGRQIVASLAETVPVLVNPQSDDDGPLNEPLFFRYGLAPLQVDLHPGMRLRVDYGVNQFVPPAESLLNGYTGGAVGDFAVSTDRNRKLSFSTFLSQIGALNVQRQSVDTIGGPLDLVEGRRHYRLFYPDQIASSTSRNTSIQANATLVGSDQLRKLATAYEDIVEDDDLLYSVFRRRAAVTPDIQIFVNDQPTYVPLGTTVRQLVQSATNWSDASIFHAMLSPKLTGADPESWPYEQAFSFRRFWGAGAVGQTGQQQYRPLTVAFVPNPESPTDPSPFDLPVVQGDRLDF